MVRETIQHENLPNFRERISPDFFKETCEYTEIGPLTFMPMMESPRPEEINYFGSGKLEEQSWITETPLGSLVSYPNHLALAIDSAYYEYYNKGLYNEVPLPEPKWLEQFDPKTRAMLRRSRAFFESSEKGFLISGYLFNKIFGFACVVDQKKENGMIKGLEDGLQLWRLRQIYQLAWLKVPAGPGDLQDNFSHDRLGHSCTVLAVASLIGRNIGLSEKDMKALQTGAFTHDVLTPAGGDRTKAIDPKAFDEDVNYLEAFTLYPGRLFPTFSSVADWKETEKQLPDKNILAEIVQGKGFLGNILDIADKISYVGSDAAIYTGGTIRFPTCFEDPDYQEIENIVKQATENQLSTCAPWSDVMKKGEQIYFSSPERLAGFLKLRALMFRNLYYNPKSRNVEHVLASVMGRALYQNKTLTREQLLTMNDYELKSVLRNNLWDSEAEGFESFSLGKIYPEITQCTSGDEAKEKFTALQKENLVLMERFYKTTSTGERLLTKVGKNIMPFSEACPTETEELRRIFASREGYVLYSVPFSKLSISKKAEEMLRQSQTTQEIK